MTFTLAYKYTHFFCSGQSIVDTTQKKCQNSGHSNKVTPQALQNSGQPNMLALGKKLHF